MGCKAEVKKTNFVEQVLQRLICEDGFPEEYVTDNGKEFMSREFKVWCSGNGIKHWKVGLKAHCSNGTTERNIRTIKEAVEKQVECILDKKIEKNNLWL